MNSIELNGENIFSGLVKLSDHRPFLKFVILWIDVIVINLLFYYFLKAVLFAPLGYSSWFWIALWGAVLLVAMFVLYGLQPWERKPSVPRFVIQSLPIILFAAWISLVARYGISTKGIDFSWVRVELLKVPLWLKLFVPQAPCFTLVFLAAVCFLMWLAIVSPKHILLRLIPSVAAFALLWKINDTFSEFFGSALNTNHLYFLKTVIYMVFFGTPLLLFSILVWFRSFRMAFRVVPLLFHMALMGLSYMGVLPVHSVFDIVPFFDERGAKIKNVPGVSVFYPPPGTDVDASFLFLRKMVLTPERLFVNYGPTCGVLSIDRHTKKMENLAIEGLIRDIQLSPDGKMLWAANWQEADFLVIDPDPFSVRCSVDLFEMGISTPWELLIDGNRVFVSNVTYPIVAEISVDIGEDECSIALDKSINFWSEGYTKFTDGVFDIHLDKGRNRLYALVGMLEGKYLLGLVELDLDTFEILRDIRLPAGTLILPVNGRDSVLLPSYYTDKIYEVSLADMKLVRTIEAEPNILSMIHDERRSLLYALSRSGGILAVIDDLTGETVRRFPIGASPSPICFDREGDQLFVGSGLGILRIQIEELLANERP